jgi:hypothetical protein
MRRRQFLASGTALLSVAVAGCGHPNVVLDMDEATDDDIADEVSTAPEPGSEEYQVVTSARDNGSATREGRYELFDRTDAVQVGGTLYEVTETRLESSEVTVYEVLVDFDPEDTTAEVGETAYEELPAFDRERLSAIASERTRRPGSATTSVSATAAPRKWTAGPSSSQSGSTTSSPTRGTDTGSRSTPGRPRRRSIGTRSWNSLRTSRRSPTGSASGTCSR